MAKKNLGDALKENFITTATETNTEEQEQKPVGPSYGTHLDMSQYPRTVLGKTQKIASEDLHKVASIKPTSTPSNRLEAPAGYKVDPRFIEVKSRRLQLVMKPSVYEKTKERAAAAGISVNEYVSRLLEAD